MKKLLALMLTLAMVLSLAACGGSTASSGDQKTEDAATEAAATEDAATEDAAPEGGAAEEAPAETAAAGTKIYVLTASPDHGWTGAVGKFAVEKVDEINAAGTYTAEYIPVTDANDQITKLEDILAQGEENIAIVIQPMDDTVGSAIQQVIDAGIPYVAFDRIIDTVAPAAVSNVKGDNAGIGAAAAAYFVGLGMKPGDKVYVMEGDTSSVTSLRDQGFEDYLLGNVEFEGATIAEDAKWTEDQLSAVTYSGAMNWSRSTAKETFETLMSDDSNTDIRWIYAEDDELSMGVFEALNGSAIADAAKAAFLGNAPAITGCGGLGEMYEVIRGNVYADISGQFSGVCSVTYSPAMIQTAIQDMVDYLDGASVEQDHVIACENVVAENVDNYPSFD